MTLLLQKCDREHNLIGPRSAQYKALDHIVQIFDFSH
jgi:hypothetical protein